MSDRWHTGRDCSSVPTFLCGVLVGVVLGSAVVLGNWLGWMGRGRG